MKLKKVRLLPVLIGSAGLLFGLKCSYLASDIGEMIAPAQAAGQAVGQAAGHRVENPSDMSASNISGQLARQLDDISTASGSQEAAKAKTSDQPASSGSHDKSGTPGAGAESVPTETVDSVADATGMSRSEIELLQELSVRRGELKKRSQQLDMRERLLQATEKRIDEKIAKLKDIEAGIKKILDVHDQQEEAQLKSLVKVYEAMKPQDAARIFEKLDMKILIEVVERMKERKVAPVLAKMSPDAAKALTVELATRKQLPPIDMVDGNATVGGS